ncbi:MAG: nucleotide exchange factor GrpE [Treponema sp.]|nr:nucleotide exchange factor GrpE [Treponema sp.]
MNENIENETAESQNESAEPQTAEAAVNEAETDSPAEEQKEPTLEEKYEALLKENAELNDKLLRQYADFDNYRKRTIKEKQEAFEYGNAGLLSDLLDSLDNFDRTLDAAKDNEAAKTIVDGIKMINSSLVSMLENKYNLSSYGAKGDEFNPDLHEAIGMMPGAVEKEELGEVYLKGYKLKDRVIRHAKVMVVKPE